LRLSFESGQNGVADQIANLADEIVPLRLGALAEDSEPCVVIRQDNKVAALRSRVTSFGVDVRDGSRSMRVSQDFPAIPSVSTSTIMSVVTATSDCWRSYVPWSAKGELETASMGNWLEPSPGLLIWDKGRIQHCNSELCEIVDCRCKTT
jgi:hypothetical protein